MSWSGSTAQQIAKAVRRGDADAAFVVDHHLRHIEDHRETEGALTSVRKVEARAEAAAVDAVDPQPTSGPAGDEAGDVFARTGSNATREALPAAGVPVAVCEQLPVTGHAPRLGSNAAVLPIAESDHQAVQRIRGAGAVVVGLGRSSELGLWPATEDDGNVPANPWRPDRGVGGPSGGTALAVATGAAAIGIGLDGPGSAGGVRTAAAACGIIAYSPDHVPADIDADPDQWLSGHVGVLATTVDDAALAYAALTHRIPRQTGDPGRLRIAASNSAPLPARVDDEATKSLLKAVRALTDLGHDTFRSRPKFGTRLTSASSGAWSCAAYLRSLKCGPDGLQRRTKRLVSVGEKTYLKGLFGGVLGDGRRVRGHLEDWFDTEDFDLLITPGMPGPPPAAQEWSGQTLRSNVTHLAGSATFTAPFSLAGLPALVVPVGTRGDGAPATVQLVGPPGSTGRLFDVAAQLVAKLRPRRYAPSLTWD
ncbi:amidase family protein [Glycomyces buryatensis]|uniref:Amidase n=1 Tax=Glycomyces buryatensis TaxID=2570927 RepID=A0A4S8QAI0_9ACTN|nr:amidase family protein [Glycomyces buryatensis]THV40491.1 amidase [Glycomyces buryatensis]